MALKPLTEEFIDELKLGLSPGMVLAAPDSYLSEPRSRWRGISSTLVLPQNVKEVSVIVRLANAKNIPIIPYGGGTGLVGGQIQDKGPSGILLSLERMNEIRSLNLDENVITVESGVILSNLRDKAEKEDDKKEIKKEAVSPYKLKYETLRARLKEKAEKEKLAKKKDEPTKGRTMTGNPASKVNTDPEINYNT